MNEKRFIGHFENARFVGWTGPEIGVSPRAWECSARPLAVAIRNGTRMYKIISQRYYVVAVVHGNM